MDGKLSISEGGGMFLALDCGTTGKTLQFAWRGQIAASRSIRPLARSDPPTVRPQFLGVQWERHNGQLNVAAASHHNCLMGYS